MAKGYKAHVDFDEKSIPAILRRPRFVEYQTRVARKILAQAITLAPRSGDNRPRHIHWNSINAGKGYTHYVGGLRLLWDVNARGLPVAYVVATRRGLLLEYGGVADTGNPKGQYILTRALLANREL